jgi:hypothetical protein
LIKEKIAVFCSTLLLGIEVISMKEQSALSFDTQLFSRYLLTFFAVSSLLVLAIIGFVSVMDSYGVVGIWNIKGFNDVKPAQHEGTRIFRPFDYLKGNYDAVIVSGSREERGIDAADSAFKTRHLSAYNFTFFESRPYEIAQVVDWVTLDGSVKLVIAGFDLLRYNVEPTSVGDYRVYYPKSQFVPWAFSQYAKLSLSLQGLQESYRTFIASRAHETVPIYLSSGRMLLHGDNPDANYDYERAFREVLDAYMNSFLPKVFDQSHGWLKSGFDNSYLREMLELAGQRRFSFLAIIPPDHALELEALRRKGLWPAFELWKWGLACEFARARTRYPETTMELWDFSGYGPLSTAPLPLHSEGQVGSMGYWDPVHYALKTGSHILEAMLEANDNSKRMLASAVALTPENIKAHLVKIRSGHDDYFSKNPSAMAWLARIDHTPVPTVLAGGALPDISQLLPANCAN